MGGRSDGWGNVVLALSPVMQRSSQSAGVRPAGNMQYQKLRSLAISLAIVLVTTRSQAGGFAIRKADRWDSTTDLDTGESSLLEVRYDLKGATAVRALVESSQIKDGTDGEIMAPGAFSSAGDNDNLNNIIITKNVTTALNEATPQDLNDSGKIDAETTKPSVDLITDANDTTQQLDNQNTSTFAEESTVSISNNVDNKSTSPTITESSKQENYENESTTTEILTSFANAQKSDTTKSSDIKSDLVSPANTGVTEAIETLDNKDIQENMKTAVSIEAINNITPEAESLFVDKDNEATYSEIKIDSETTTASPPPTTEYTSNKLDVEITTELNAITDHYLSSDTTISDINSETTTDIDQGTTTHSDTTEMYLENKYSGSTEFQTEKSFNTETNSDDLITTTLPPWKNYKTINRKRPTAMSIEETTLIDGEMKKSESARISLEKVLNNTPIPSLEQLKNDLLNAPEYTTKTDNVASVTEINETSTPALEKSSSSQDMTEGVITHTPKIEVFASKRAGYLDNKEITTLEPPQLATAIIYEDKDVSNDTENFGTMYETEVSEGEAGEPHYARNSTGAESQSQLVEDAMKEELLMEKIENENNLLKEEARQRDPLPPLGNRHPVLDEISSTPEVITEDLLSVKPISHEKRKNNSIYVTSSLNYKPLKKLDIQPPKQFVRDPDDNSWRNESISSLGIVFKPKNASKSFTEVLKNKTTELSNMVDKGDKNDVPDLRVRLEKIAEVRKSKKKRVNKYGDTVYSDYEENSGENANLSKEDVPSGMINFQKTDIASTTPIPPVKTDDLTVNDIWKDKLNLFQDDVTTTEKLKKLYNLADYYDATDDYDADYVTLSKIDLKRFTVPYKTKDAYYATRPPDVFTTRPTKPTRITYMPDRQPTVQYFPPTKKANIAVTPKVNVNDYDDRFNQKVNMYAYKEIPKAGYDVPFATASPVQTKRLEQAPILTPKPVYTSTYQAGNMDKKLFLTSRPRITEPETQGGILPNDGTFNRASYVIKHYKDFINDAAKDNDDDKSLEYLPYTEAPMQGVTVGGISHFPTERDQKEPKAVEDYDYDTNFRKDIMNRFVDNFNQNSERFKVDFPILYNSSVVHRKEEQNGKVLASSSAFMKRLYETTNPRSQFLLNVKPCNANCEALTVDLSPAYELHYYVPDQEEKEEIETRPNTLPYRSYRL